MEKIHEASNPRAESEQVSLLPARMLNEFVYCPRLFALEHLDGEWAESADTVRGSRVHKRVDRPDKRPLVEGAPIVRRSLDLGCDELGVVTRIDLVEFDGKDATPVDYKKGKVPKNGPWDPERVQVCLQALLLRAHGYRVERAVLYFAGSKKRVDVPIDEELVALTMQAIHGARALVDHPKLPAPLNNSPKCVRCSLVGICLPDEHHRLRDPDSSVRPIAPMRLDALPLHVEHRGAKLALSGGEIVVKVEGKVVERVRIGDTSAVVMRGAGSVTTPLLHALAAAGIPLSLHRWSGWHVADLVPVSGHHAIGRRAQHRVSVDEGERVAIARRIIEGKIHNQRIMVRRNGRGDQRVVLAQLKTLRDQAARASDVGALLGYEGSAARAYFGVLPTLLRERELAAMFQENGRNRRPPRDPVNALLSFAYSMLARECTTVLNRVGLDPYVGVFHQIRPGRAALALDLMEEFRPIVADSAVLRAINGGVVQLSDFLIRSTGVRLSDAGRRKFIRVFEERMGEEIVHPTFGYRMAYRRIIEVQARLLSKAFTGEVGDYRAFKVR